MTVRMCCHRYNAVRPYTEARPAKLTPAIDAKLAAKLLKLEREGR